MSRHSRTTFSRPSERGTPAWMDAWDMNVMDERAAALPYAPNALRYQRGCGVGMDAFGSPMTPWTICPPLMIRSGLTPKNLGSHSTRSANLPSSTEPTAWETPWAIAGLIVYLEM